MPGLNTTGKPQTEDYVLGRGAIYLAEIDTSTGKPKGYRHVGNVPEFNLSIEVETQEHQSSLEGLRKVDKEVIISQALTLNFQLDELNHQNLADFFSGETGSHTNVTIAGFSEFEMVSSAVLGQWYDIVNSSGERAYGVTLGDLTLEVNTTPLVEGTDFTLDSTMGRIFLLSDASNVTAGDAIDVTLAAAAGAGDVEEVRGLTKTNILSALKFISINPANNDAKTEYQFHQVNLKPDGDFSLISDDFTTMGFTAAAEANSDADPDSPTLTVRRLKPAA